MTGTDTPPMEVSATLALVVAARPKTTTGAPSSDAHLATTLQSAQGHGTGNRWDEILVTGTRSIPPYASASRGRSLDGPTPVPARSWTDASADFLVLLPAGSLLSSHATDRMRDLIQHNPEVDLAYFDSTTFDEKDPTTLSDPHHRPGYSPERLQAQMYLGEMLLVRRSVAERFDLDGDLLQAPLAHSVAGRLAVRCRTVAHLPQVLYRTPRSDPASNGGQSTANGGQSTTDRLAGHRRWLEEQRFPATVMIRPGSEAIIDLEPRLIETPQVSIIIPTNGARRTIDDRAVTLCLQAVDSIIAKTSYLDYELVIVITPGSPPDLANQILATIESRTGARRPTVRFCRDDRPFNFSNACNRGAVAAAGDVLVFLNDDTVVRSRNWIDRLVMYATRPDIGAVGARLLYADGSIQHAGIWSRGGHPTHRYERFPADHPGYLDSLLVPQNCLAVTGACLAVATDKFHQVGGFSPQFPSSYNDVDLCLKLSDVGYRTVVDPAVVLTHFEASSRDPKIDDWELALLHERWRSVVVDDLYDNPHHLAPASEEYPPPDPVITEQKRQAGWVDFLPRLWPADRLTIDPTHREPDVTTTAGPMERSDHVTA